MSGRGVRSKDDWCDTWILDKQAEKLIAKSRKMFPKYWVDNCRYGQIIKN
jgi:hypothetical protein